MPKQKNTKASEKFSDALLLTLKVFKSKKNSPSKSTNAQRLNNFLKTLWQLRLDRIVHHQYLRIGRNIVMPFDPVKH